MTNYRCRSNFCFTHLFLTLFLAAILLAACAPAEAPPTAKPTKAEDTPVSTQTSAPTPTSEPSITSITIDGEGDDWQGRDIITDDPIGDAEAGFLDFGKGYAFVNQDALYFLIETPDTEAEFELFDMNFQAADRVMQITWFPGQEGMKIVDWSSGSPKDFGLVKNSSFALGSYLEGRIDLSDLGSPAAQDMGIASIMVMSGEGGSWRPVDDWGPEKEIPLVNEIDSPILSSEEEAYVLARRFNVPPGYIVKKVMVPAAPDINGIARSESGVVYLQHIGQEPGISLLDTESGQATRILDLSPKLGTSIIAGGPGDTAFISQSTEVMQINPDGSFEIYSFAEWAFPRYYSLAEDRLFGISHNDGGGRLVEFMQNGGTQDVLGGFSNLYDVVADENGILFASEHESGQLMRIELDGTKKVINTNMLRGDTIHLAIGPDKMLYSSEVYPGLSVIDPNTGAKKTLPRVFEQCGFREGEDFVFISENELVLIDPTFSQVHYRNLETDAHGILVSNDGTQTYAAEVGPDGALYVGAWGCGETPSRVLRVSDDGDKEVVIDDIQGQIRDIAFDQEGGMFTALYNWDGTSQLLYLPASQTEVVEIPTTGIREPILSIAVDPISQHLFVTELNTQVQGNLSVKEFDLNGLVAEHKTDLSGNIIEFRIDFSQDGTLYAFVGMREDVANQRRDRWVVTLDLQNSTSQVLAELHRESLGDGPGNISADADGVVWVVVDPEFEIYRITLDGEVTLFASGLPIDPLAVAVNKDSELYFTSAGGIFKIYPEP